MPPARKPALYAPAYELLRHIIRFLHIFIIASFSPAAIAEYLMMILTLLFISQITPLQATPLIRHY
jgi:hypothetical protein